MSEDSAAPQSGFSRRRLLGLGGAGAVGVVVGAAGLRTAEAVEPSAAGADAKAPVPFQGRHQSGVATPVQDRLHIVAFDVTTDSRDELVALLKEWTAAAAQMTQGDPVGGHNPMTGPPHAPPDDTGEAWGLPPSALTLTIGFGPSLFTKNGTDRFGIAHRQPRLLQDLPSFRGDDLDPDKCGGDIVVQACANDPVVAVHAIRNLARLGFGRAAVRWSQLGFGKTSSTTPKAQTPRNLFGFKDGTDNIAHDDTETLRKQVWVGADDGPDWMVGGTYLAGRRIRMHIETWDRESLYGQQHIVGRTKGEGAPLGQDEERDPVHIKALPAHSHVALAHPDANDGHMILRRGYSFVDGSDNLGRLDAGLYFIAFCRNPQTQFIPLQDKLAKSDAMAEYLVHTGSGLWACPPGIRNAADWWGRTLFT